MDALLLACYISEQPPFSHLENGVIPVSKLIVRTPLRIYIHKIAIAASGALSPNSLGHSASTVEDQPRSFFQSALAFFTLPGSPSLLQAIGTRESLRELGQGLLCLPCSDSAPWWRLQILQALSPARLEEGGPAAHLLLMPRLRRSWPCFSL